MLQQLISPDKQHAARISRDISQTGWCQLQKKFPLVLCREAKTQVGSESDNFRQNRVESIRVNRVTWTKIF